MHVDVRQEIRFCSVDGQRVAYATVGSGPLLILPALWASHLELEWEFEEFRRFIAALARGRTVVRYDRLGTGLSDRNAPLPESALQTEVQTLAEIVRALDAEELSLLGISLGGCAAVAFAATTARHVRSLALVGAFAHGEDVAPAPLREALLSTVRAHWGAGARALSDIWLPGANAKIRERFTQLQRAAASPAVAADLLAAVYDADVRQQAGEVRAPALVVHRRHDRAIPFAAGRALASLLPDARLVALDGDPHIPWLGDSDAVIGALTSFFERHEPTGLTRRDDAARVDATDGTRSLTARQVEILRLVADGLSDAEIAERLTVSPHTVHRHVANIRTKLGQPSRAAAAAQAARLGII
jgi:pimeloyl-ACP methyl ester carboxylesterase/DNA-binding CsgD family transcriptional regulator